MNAIAIIPARGGSTRIPRKNIRLFHGKPILAYSIEIARKSNLFSRIIVSTEDVEIATIAKKYGADVHVRSDSHARNEVGTQAVMRHALKDINTKEKFACCIYATSPLMRVEDLVEGLHHLRRANCDFVFSVSYPPLQDAAQFYWGRVSSFLSGVPLVSPTTRMINVPSDYVQDINTEEDWKLAEVKFTALKGNQ